MLRVTVVDDDLSDSALIREFLDRFSIENNIQIEKTMYNSAVDLLEDYRGSADILLLDVDMPCTDGLTAARELRARDDRVAIVFITNMAQYAIKGYEVDACDFMVKPITYPSFAQKLRKAAEWSDKRRGHHVILTDDGNPQRIRTSNILWLEKDRNYLVWHTKNGEFRERGTVADAKNKLRSAGVDDSFAECCTGFIVNLERVDAICKDTLTVDGHTLPISRRLRKDFIHAYATWG